MYRTQNDNHVGTQNDVIRKDTAVSGEICETVVTWFGNKLYTPTMDQFDTKPTWQLLVFQFYDFLAKMKQQQKVADDRVPIVIVKWN